MALKERTEKVREIDSRFTTEQLMAVNIFSRLPIGFEFRDTLIIGGSPYAALYEALSIFLDPCGDGTPVNGTRVTIIDKTLKATEKPTGVSTEKPTGRYNLIIFVTKNLKEAFKAIPTIMLRHLVPHGIGVVCYLTDETDQDTLTKLAASLVGVRRVRPTLHGLPPSPSMLLVLEVD